MGSEFSSTDGDFTRDSLFAGRLEVLQPQQGYRFSVDAVLLAHFIAPRPGERVLDLGTGCGILPLLLSYRFPEIGGLAVEIQPRLADLARRNLELNGLAGHWQVVEHDFRRLPEIVPAGSFDWAISNPPYRQAGSGRASSGEEQAIARHELQADLPALVAGCRHAVRTGGRAAVVYPASRAAALIAALKEGGLEPKRLQIVYSYPGSTGRLVLIEAVRAGGEELQILPPFFIYQEAGGPYAEKMAACYRP